MLVSNDKKIYAGSTQIIKAYQGTDVVYEYQQPSSVKIYGVKREIASSSPAWERLNDAVGLTANATHDGTAVINDFDNIYPYSNIISYEYDTVNDEIVSYYGDADFTFSPSDANIDVLTKIPEFWWKRYQEDGWEYIYIADGEVAGFTKSEEFSIGRYLTTFSNSKAMSKSNYRPSYDRIENARNYTTSKSANYCLFDWRYFIIQLLYLVEYANYNSQEMLGNGVQNNSVYNTGGCDSLGMKSGCLINDNSGQVIYRGIEDIFGHFFNTLDGMVGIPINDILSITYDPSDYATRNNASQVSYTYTGSGSWPNITAVGYDANNPLVQLPTSTSSGSRLTGLCDGAFIRASSGNRVVEFGGARTLNASYAGTSGLWCTAIVNSYTSSYSDMGYRILKYK